jgi:hypothetical protein
MAIKVLSPVPLPWLEPYVKISDIVGLRAITKRDLAIAFLVFWVMRAIANALRPGGN